MIGALTRVAGWAASVFQHIEVRGGPIPEGPVIVAANHQNSLLDPLVVFRVAGRPTRPLAKASLFDQRLLGSVLRAMGGLPVYRRQDAPTEMHRNAETFRAAIDALRSGDALQIFPEGRSHSEPALEPLRTGAARIALAAEVQAGGELGLQVVPVGLTWQNKHRFRGRVLADIGEPFGVTEWLTDEGADDEAAVRSLTAELSERLRAHILELAVDEDLGLVLAADAVYSRARGLHAPRGGEGLADRVPRLRRHAEALAWLRANDPDYFERLSARIRRHARVGRILGGEDGKVPDRYPLGAVLRYLVREGLALVVGLPVFLVGIIVWYPAWIIPQWVVRRVDPDPEAIATYKLAASFFTVPATIALVAAGGFLLDGVRGAVVGAALTPVIGGITLAWHERWDRVRDDIAIFFRAIFRPRLRERLARRRSHLADEFDVVLERMGGPGTESDI